MDAKNLQKHMHQYHSWKEQLVQRLERFDRWIDEYGLAGPEVAHCLKRARQLLRGDSFTIACVGEFSRGKTELINALLHTAGNTRLLPSQPGRTTMCPTEIYCEPGQHHNCVRLLPIETRRTRTSLHQFMRIPNNWVTIPFDPKDPAQVRAAIGQVSADKRVTPAEARELGFSDRELDRADDDGLVSVPTWRHALISLDHPLLRQGLRIIDTPGLNALGNEPELTLKTLPEAQAVLFLLAADSGVSASDMAIWEEHIQLLRDNHCTAVLALLNKIDTLWDDLLPPREVTENVERIRRQTARQLTLSPDHVLPLSAKLALLAKVDNNSRQLERSHFPRLERLLAECVVRNQQQIVGHRLVGDSHDFILNTYSGLQRRLRECETEIGVLRNAPEPEDTSDTLQQLRDAIRQTHHQYHKQSLSLRTSHKLLEKQRPALEAPIKPALLEQQIADTLESLSTSWTSLGLTRAISDFCDAVDAQVDHLHREAERANRLLISIYERPEHQQTNDEILDRHLFRIHAPRRRLRLLRERADSFRASLSTLLSSRSTLIERFINTLVQEVRNCFEDINRAVDHWLKEAMTPLFHQNQYQKQLLEHHMLRLGEMQNQRHSHSEQLDKLQDNIERMRAALADLEPLYREVTAEPLSAPTGSDNVLSIERARQAQSG